jgi:hypothetical protein
MIIVAHLLYCFFEKPMTDLRDRLKIGTISSSFLLTSERLYREVTNSYLF